MSIVCVSAKLGTIENCLEVALACHFLKNKYVLWAVGKDIWEELLPISSAFEENKVWKVVVAANPISQFIYMKWMLVTVAT